jgi:hypothetical protein
VYGTLGEGRLARLECQEASRRFENRAKVTQYVKSQGGWKVCIVRGWPCKASADRKVLEVAIGSAEVEVTRLDVDGMLPAYTSTRRCTMAGEVAGNDNLKPSNICWVQESGLGASVDKQVNARLRTKAGDENCDPYERVSINDASDYHPSLSSSAAMKKVTGDTPWSLSLRSCRQSSELRFA